MENKTNNNEIVTEQKEDLTNFEKIQFMQFEYDWQKHRRKSFVEAAELHLAWIGGIFAFWILFTDCKEIILFLKNNQNENLQILSIISLIVLLFGLVFLSISAFQYNDSKQVSTIDCFDIETIYDNGFKLNEILKDYKDIVVDYDKVISELSKKVVAGDKNMKKGVILLLVSELVLKIVVSL